MAGRNYIVACWSGSRRRGENGLAILNDHVESLERVPHSLDQIIFAVPHNPDEPPAYRDKLRSLPRKIRDARVTVLERPNHGMSYGCWADAISLWSGQFDLHFVMEDDYVFVMSDFDDILAESSSLAGYVCGDYRWDHAKCESSGRPLGVMSCGVIRDDAATGVAKLHGGKIPYLNTVYDFSGGMLHFTGAFRKSSYGISPWPSKWGWSFRNGLPGDKTMPLVSNLKMPENPRLMDCVEQWRKDGKPVYPKGGMMPIGQGVTDIAFF